MRNLANHYSIIKRRTNKKCERCGKIGRVVEKNYCYRCLQEYYNEVD